MKTKRGPFFHKIWSVLNGRKAEKAVFIAAPAITLLLAALLLWLVAGWILSGREAKSASLRAVSTENDLLVTVCGPDGRTVTGAIFTLTFTYPDGNWYSFKTDAEGGCYLVQLEAGEYGVSMDAQHGYAAPEPVRCTVLEKPAEERIELLKNGEGPADAAEPVYSEEGWRETEGRLYYYDGGEPVHGLKKIDGKFYFFDESGVCAPSLGVDVSYFDGEINWPAVKAQGFDAAIIRVGGRTWGNGRIYDDYRARQYLAGAKAAGFRVGVYFYSTAVTEAEAVQEAGVTLSAVDGIALDLPIFIDMEPSGSYPEGRADKLSARERGGIIKAFCETVENSGYEAGVYSGEYFMKRNLDYGSFARYKVWLASYTSGGRLPNFGDRYDIWQFTDTAQVDGIPGWADLNVFF